MWLYVIQSNSQPINIVDLISRSMWLYKSSAFLYCSTSFSCPVNTDICSVYVNLLNWVSWYSAIQTACHWITIKHTQNWNFLKGSFIQSKKKKKKRTIRYVVISECMLSFLIPWNKNGNILWMYWLLFSHAITVNGDCCKSYIKIS